ncbi:hypothetical protein [Halioglobus sp. HI00S01]|uniref:hypothetical protein n=1 Tax=Halioglobus sp. HI00S01 TaxID=1822214 RepID=UPI0012E7464D|nr:hypothetical protein [Halioglobus sp. HI00S01]
MIDGTLVTAVKIRGMRHAARAGEMAVLLDFLTGKFGSYTKDGAHYFSTWFERDESDTVRDELERTYGKCRASTAAMGADFSDIIDEQIDVLSMCSRETAVLLLYTTANGLSKDERSLLAKRHDAASEGTPYLGDAQPLTSFSINLLPSHSSFVAQTVSDLGVKDIETQPLSSVELLKLIRSGVTPEYTADEWEPRVPGSITNTGVRPPPLRVPEEQNWDYSQVFWPQIAKQLFPVEAVANHSTCEIGGRIYAPVSIALQPESPEFFQALFARLNRSNIPWRVHQLARGDALAVFGLKSVIAQMLRWSGPRENVRIVEAKKALTMAREDGIPLVQLQTVFCTWGPASDPLIVEERRATLVRCIQAWGNAEVELVEGDSLESFCCTLPGNNIGSVGSPAAAPLYDVLRMAPLTRPTTAWEDGSQPLRTKDGKLIHFEPYSTKQQSWVHLVTGSMGGGKSVYLNSCNLSLILKSDLRELPFIGIIDVGPNSKGLIDLIHSAFPQSMHHLALYKRLTNTADSSINVLDTPLGLRVPLSMQRNQLIAFITLLVTPDSQEDALEGTSGFVSALIDQAYRQKSTFGTENKYERGINRVIDSALDDLNFSPDHAKVMWWEVVDHLAQAGETHSATIAQRYAVPTLGDLVMLCNDENILEMYGGNTVADTNETLPRYMYRRLTDAMNQYPILSGMTQFDLGEARIVSFDLDEVAKGGSSGAGKRRTGVMYLLSFQVLTARYFLTEEHLLEIQTKDNQTFDYRTYHREQIKAIRRLPKRIVVDEKHRVKGITMVENQFDVAIREGRKLKLDVCFASQLATDWTQAQLNLATQISVVGTANASMQKELIDTFNLSPAMAYELKNNMRKPSPEGATVLSIFETEEGTYEHLLYSTQGPRFIWATNSNADDRYVRIELSNRIGLLQARTLLVNKFPSGTLGALVAQRKAALGIDTDSLDGSTEDDSKPLLDGIVMELVEEYADSRSGFMPSSDSDLDVL